MRKIIMYIIGICITCVSALATDHQNNAGKILNDITYWYQTNMPGAIQDKSGILALVAVFIVIYWLYNHKKVKK